jgi:hypothetical protein
MGASKQVMAIAMMVIAIRITILIDFTFCSMMLSPGNEVYPVK